MTDLARKAASSFAVLVTFSWGDANVSRYTTYNRPINVGGYAFAAVPQMTVNQDTPSTVGTEEEVFKVRIPTKYSPASTLSLPFKHARVNVLIEEIDPNDHTTRREVFFGKVAKVRVSPKGEASMTEIEVRGIKARLKILRIGAQALSECIHEFGDSLCGFNLEAAKQTGIVSEIRTGGYLNRISVDVDGGGSLDENNFRRGYVLVDGVNITIRKVVSNAAGTAVLDLREIPPPSWDGLACSIYPGCDKSLTACREAFRNREESFLALGRNMPPYNPAFSDSPTTS